MKEVSGVKHHVNKPKVSEILFAKIDIFFYKKTAAPFYSISYIFVSIYTSLNSSNFSHHAHA